MGFSDEMKTMCGSLAQSRSDRDKAMRELHSDHSRDRMERMATIKRTAGDVKRLFGDVHVLIQHFHTDRGKMSKELRQMLEGYFEGIQKNVRGFLREFRTQHKAMSGKQQEELEAFCNGLRREVSRMRKEFRSEHKAMGEKQHEELRTFCNGLQRDVNQMRRGFQQAQKALHADFQKAQGYWMEFAGGMHRPKASPKAAVKASGLQGRIMAALKGSPEGMTPKELSYAMGMPEKGLKRALTRMRKEKHLRKRKSTFFAR
jgi:hypothetical protein